MRKIHKINNFNNYIKSIRKNTIKSVQNNRDEGWTYVFWSTTAIKETNLSLPIAGDEGNCSNDVSHFKYLFDKRHNSLEEAIDACCNSSNIKEGFNRLFINIEKYMIDDAVSVSQLYNFYSLLCQYTIEKKTNCLVMDKYNCIIANYNDFVLSLQWVADVTDNTYDLIILLSCVDGSDANIKTYKFGSDSIMYIIEFLNILFHRSSWIRNGKHENMDGEIRDFCIQLQSE